MNEQLFSEDYIGQLKGKHDSSSHFGKQGCQFGDHIQILAKKIDTQDILDYGCGKGTLQLHLPYDIQQYDPAVEKYSHRPRPADIVACTDVLEHVEPQFIDNVIRDLVALTKRVLFVNIPIREAVKHLPDGRNTHLLVKPAEWWIMKMWEHGWFWGEFNAEPGMQIYGQLVQGYTETIGRVDPNKPKEVKLVRVPLGQADA